MGKVIFSERGWAHYVYWQETDRKTAKRINQLLKDIQRNGPGQGIGKPESLRHETGWSRRIDGKNRLLYEYEHGDIYVTGCRGHYDD